VQYGAVSSSQLCLMLPRPLIERLHKFAAAERLTIDDVVQLAVEFAKTKSPREPGAGFPQ
jgi:hypothetical protein